jgi:DNA modification methylase
MDEPRSLDDYFNPQYLAMANPNLTNFILTNRNNKIKQTTPFPHHLAAGKNTYVYDAHTYHTKVPPKSIETLIKHYTHEGDFVLDVFCGSGMTGVAALESKRKPILIDLSPAATFISYNLLTPIKSDKYMNAIYQIMRILEDEEIKLFGTHCRDCEKLVPMEYMVWSYGLICSNCEKEFILWDVARDEREKVKESKIKSEFNCSHCGTHLKKKGLRRTKVYPVLVGYRCCESGRQESKSPPDEYDLTKIQEIENLGIPPDLWYPRNKLPNGVNTRQAMTQGLETIDSLYTTRSLRMIAHLWDIARKWPDEEISLKLLFTITSLYKRVTKLSEFRFWGGSGNIANYNVPMIFNEQNVLKVFHRKAKTINLYLKSWNTIPNPYFCISTQSSTNLASIPSKSIDYVFTDPPFGGNINYSEMNFIWESWLGVLTDNTSEAIVNRVQKKSILEYEIILKEVFSEVQRVLKDDGWLTVVFHNSSAKVWEAIQNALATSGFVINATQTLDKRHGTFKQFVSANAVGYDL